MTGGPAGLEAAWVAAARGHKVRLVERADRLGGQLNHLRAMTSRHAFFDLLAFQERQLARLGVEVELGRDAPAAEILASRPDVVVLATGSRIERGIDLPGNDLPGIHTAMSYLVQRNRDVAGLALPEISATGKHVVVIGGGDTAADCVASAHREGAQSVTQLDIYPPPAGQKFRQLAQWPDFPKRLWSTYALDEGGQRYSSFNATAFTGNGHVAALTGDHVGRPPDFDPTGETLELPVDLVLIAIGFTGPERPLLEALGVEGIGRGIDTADYATNVDGVFAAGDARRGQSLIVTAIAEGRGCSRAVARYLRSN